MSTANTRNRLAGALGQCFACAILERTLGKNLTFNYWNDADKSMSIDLQFNCQRIMGVFSKGENVFIDVKASLDYRNCTVQTVNPMINQANLNGHGYFMFVFRDERWIGVCRSTDSFIQTFGGRMKNGGPGFFIVRPDMFSDMAASRPDIYWKMPLPENDWYGTTFGEFYRRYSKEFAGFEKAGDGEGRYVNEFMLDFCRCKAGLNCDIENQSTYHMVRGRT